MELRRTSSITSWLACVSSALLSGGGPVAVMCHMTPDRSATDDVDHREGHPRCTGANNTPYGVVRRLSGGATGPGLQRQRGAASTADTQSNGRHDDACGTAKASHPVLRERKLCNGRSRNQIAFVHVSKLNDPF